MNNEVRALLSYAVTQLSTLSQIGSTECKVCGAEAVLFDVLDFGRQCNLVTYPDGLAGIPIYYHRCSACRLIFTRFFDGFDTAAWSSHVYNTDYARIDPEYGDRRACRNAGLVNAAASSCLSGEAKGCDYGGGTGATARLLSAAGRSFDTFDPFAKQDASVRNGAYRFVSAFEVLEHVPDPTETFARMTALLTPGPAMMLISTSTCDGVNQPGDLARWWYAAPRNGHITLYSQAALRRLASSHHLTYRQVTGGLHLFGRDVSLSSPSWALRRKKILQRLFRV